MIETTPQFPFDEAQPVSASADERLRLDLDGWEGPLDLLLALARSQKVDLKQISILQLVEQYLDYIERVRHLLIELAADYLVMAAWLALLKSALLLPREVEADPDPDELALRLQLRLQRLQAMRDAGARLFGRDRLGRDVFMRGAPEGLRVDTKKLWDASLFDLLQAYGVVQARTRPVIHIVARREVMPLDAAIERMSRLIGAALDWSDLISFLPPGLQGDLQRSALASSFVAALELARMGKLDIRQDEAFAPLYVRKGP